MCFFRDGLSLISFFKLSVVVSQCFRVLLVCFCSFSDSRAMF